MDHFWRSPVRCGRHTFIGHSKGFHRPFGETVKFGSYLIDDYGRYWNAAMVRNERELSWEWNK